MTIAVKVSPELSRLLQEVVNGLVERKVASRLFNKDFTIWGQGAESEAKLRLGWVDTAEESLDWLEKLENLRRDLMAEGINNIVLCGMGGSSLAPEVISRTEKVFLEILDSTNPSQVSHALSGNLAHKAVVVSSKSGSTVETDSHFRAFKAAFQKSGINPVDRIFIVTDPGSPLDLEATSLGYRVFPADPNVGGRYSALTLFGVVPCVLAGVEFSAILKNAIGAKGILKVDDESNPALLLAAALARTPGPFGYRDKVGLLAGSSSPIGFNDWLEQLIAESTGKLGKGLLPVPLLLESPEWNLNLQDVLKVTTGASSAAGADVTVDGSLGELLLLWEVSTAVASELLGVNPFDQPDVESAKLAARELLGSITNEGSNANSENLSFSSSNLAHVNPSDALGAIKNLLASVGAERYLSIQAFLDRDLVSEAKILRDAIAMKTNRPVTFGWGPRYLHSTGQYHKGGPKLGVFLQIIDNSERDLAIPGRDFGFRQLMLAQARGDAEVLSKLGRPVLSFKFKDVDSGIKELITLIESTS